MGEEKTYTCVAMVTNPAGEHRIIFSRHSRLKIAKIQGHRLETLGYTNILAMDLPEPMPKAQAILWFVKNIDGTRKDPDQEGVFRSSWRYIAADPSKELT